MCPKTFILAVTLTTRWANSYMLAQDKVPTDLQRLSPSMTTVAGATLEEYIFPCQEEGFYSHSSDCTKFYRCKAVSNIHDYLQLVYKCHAGSIFSPEYKSCISGTCSSGLASAVASEAEASAAASAAAATSTTTATVDDEFVVPSIRHRDIHSGYISSQYGIPQCNSLGRFADPENCEKFYDCVPSHSGGFVAHQGSCYGHAFHPTLKACVAPGMVEGCFVRSTRMSHVTEDALHRLCINKTNAFICADCKTLLICLGQDSYKQSCEFGNVCNMKANNTFGGAVCFPGDPVECTCRRTGCFNKDYYAPYKFLTCAFQGADPIIHSCPDELEYTPGRRTCGKGIPIDIAAHVEPTCAASGSFAVFDDCTRYFIFTYSTKGWVHKESTCRTYTMFNEETEKCEDPCDWYSGIFTCEAQGRFANRADCTKYYECIADPLKSNELSWVEYECPEGFEWSPMGIGTGYCLPTEYLEQKCVPQKPNKCKVPPEWCIPDVCSPNCINGVCTGPNICSCIPHWTGDLCETPMCSSACINGNCTGPNECSCNSGWSGDLCNTPVCSPNCDNGDCVSPNRCECNSGWSGNLCKTECSEVHGFTLAGGSNECFKVFNDRSRTWDEAKSKCISAGLQLAEPTDAVAVMLRKDLIDKYGNHYMWLGARGDNSFVRWQSNNEEIPSDAPLWYPNLYSVSSSKCLSLLVHTTNMNFYPIRPYSSSTKCSDHLYTLCELV